MGKLSSRRAVEGMVGSSEQDFLDLGAPLALNPSACLTGLVHTIAEQNPDSIAVSFQERRLTYRELDRESTQLTATLIERGVGTGTLVGLLVDRSPGMIVALLAILKAGAAYVPLDPLYPPARLSTMLSLSGAALLITQDAVRTRLSLKVDAPTLLLDEWEREQAGSKVIPFINRATPQGTAYVIFTSGSTGQPKGVEISNSALVNLLWSLKERPGISHRDTILAVTSISFDMAVPELLLPLGLGARIEMATREEAGDPQRLIAKLNSCAVTILQATPVTWRLLIHAGWTGHSQLRVWCGGEEMTRSLAADLLSRSSSVWNLYGPTETTVWSSVSRITKAERVPLGLPVLNTSLHVLDEERHPVAPGGSGELYIGGAGLAKSYWHRPDLTEQSFLNITLADGQDVRLYRTGDRVRAHNDGTLEFLGRVDRQVKLRGFRIELGEVEQAASTYPGVREVVVAKVEEGERGAFLAAYVVLTQGHSFDASQLRRHIAESLPRYMVPSAICVLASLPVTPNGKIDRKQLPTPTEQERAFATADSDAAPHYELEARIAKLWRETLKTSSIGRNDNFFSIGGDSLLAAQLVARMAKAFGRRCNVASLLQSSSIAEYASFLAGDDVSTCIVLQQGSPAKQSSKIFWMDHPDRLHRLAGLLEDQPFYCMLLSADALAAEAPSYSMERLAARMVKQILDHQSAGRFYIGGFCQNALLAYEVSRQLQAQGHDVPLLIMIDPEVASARTDSAPMLESAIRRVDRERFHLSTMLKQPPSDWIPYLQRRYEGIRFVLEEKKWQRGARGKESLTQPARELAHALFVSRLSYVPRPYKGRVLFIEPTLRLEQNEEQTIEEWSTLVERGEWRYVRGDHLGLFNFPGVHLLAQEVQRALDASLS